VYGGLGFAVFAVLVGGVAVVIGKYNVKMLNK
jgi:hypothetical protein